MLVSITNVSSELLKSLESSETIKVHSVFNSGVNIKTKDRLIYVGHRDGPSSINIMLAQLVNLKEIKVDDLLSYRDKQLTFNSINLVLDLSNAHQLNYQLSEGKLNFNSKRSVLRIVHEYNFISGFDKNIASLIDYLTPMYEKDCNKCLNYLFGRGIGLTPSGDDFIVGLLAYHSVEPFLSKRFIEELTNKVVLNQTTDISISYLQDALKGLFSREVLDLFEAMKADGEVIKHIYAISNFGHSSGIDTLSGICAAILWSNNQGENNE